MIYTNLSVFLFSFVITIAVGCILWWMVFSKEQRLSFYDWIDSKFAKHKKTAV